MREYVFIQGMGGVWTSLFERAEEVESECVFQESQSEGLQIWC